MHDVALAYTRTGNQERADEALVIADRHMKSIAEQGVRNFIFSGQLSIHYAMLGDVDAAFEHLEQAAKGGWVTRGVPEVVIPQYAVMADDPRMDAIEAIMLEVFNRDRAFVGLPPVDASYEVRL